MNDQFRLSAESPCIKVCVVDPESDLCIGCGRKRAEIAGWLGFSPEDRQAITAELPGRMTTLTSRKRRKGGARAKRRNEGL